MESKYWGSGNKFFNSFSLVVYLSSPIFVPSDKGRPQLLSPLMSISEHQLGLSP
jgi:hypothetical protein